MPWNENELVLDLADKKQIRTLLAHKKKVVRTQRFWPVRQLVKDYNTISEVAIDITSDNSLPTPLQLLEKLPVKYLGFFHPDFDLNTRPPYRGTYTRTVSPKRVNKLSKNPTYRGLPDTNYDYDSEVEWEPPQEGDEDINLEDEESEDEAEDEEMDDFLDDAEDNTKRRAVVREMEAVCSGICWQGSTFDARGINMHGYKMDVLDDAHHFPIDPYATHYWARIEKETIPKTSKSLLHTMQPPRVPLSCVNAPNHFQPIAYPFVSKPDPGSKNSENILHAGAPKLRKSANKALKMIPDEMLAAFKIEVEGSDLTKVGLIEVLKKRFPKASKDSIKDTLNVIAVREGAKGQEKKWKLV